MEKATPQQRRLMAQHIKFLNELKPHYIEDNKPISVIRDSKINEIARIEQQNHVIPIHRGNEEFIPIVWNRSLEYQYELIKTMYEPTYLKFR